MSFGMDVRGSGLSLISSYETAVAREAGITPLRGSGPNAGLKPLGKRTKTYLTIRKNEKTEDVIIRLYRTDIIRFEKGTGKIWVNHGGYPTQTTNGVLTALLPAYFSGGWVNCHCEGLRGYFPLKDGPNAFWRASDGGLRMVEPNYPVVHRVNRKGANAVRKRYAELRTYVRGVLKLRKGVLPASAGRVYNAFTMLTSPDHEERQLAVDWLCYDSVVSRWAPNEGYKSALDADKAMRALDKLLFAQHRDEVYEAVTVKTGSFVKDKHAQ